MDKVFISYSWDDEDHKIWVRKLANDLIKNGINISLDQYEVSIGDSFTHFMEKSVNDSKYVIVILTPTYNKKSLERSGGVGYEQQIITGEIMGGIESRKFIPILRKGTLKNGEDCAIPPHFKGIAFIDFKSDSKYDDSIEELIRTIFSAPKFTKPILGNKPVFESSTDEHNKFIIDLDENFKFKGPGIRIIDLLTQIADLRKKEKKYRILFKVEKISEYLDEYEGLKNKSNLSDSEVQRKVFLRELLHILFYKYNANLFEYFETGLNLIIDWYFNHLRYKFILTGEELLISVSNYFQLFNKNLQDKSMDETRFDVINDNLRFNYKLNVDEEQLNSLLNILNLNIEQKMFLTRHAGLYLLELSRNTIITRVIPKHCSHPLS